MIHLDDIADVVAATIFTILALAVFWSVLRVDPKILKSKRGWLMMALAMMLFAVRAYGHFLDASWFQIMRRIIGLANAFLLPVALYLIHRQFREHG